MGRERACEGTWEGRTSKGVLLLETEAVLFRGERRLSIPLRAIRSAKADAGRLVLRWTGGEASFHLGADSAAWAHRIMNPKGRLEKLGVKPGHLVRLVGVTDAGFEAEIEAAGARFAQQNADLTFLGAEKEGDLSKVGKQAATLEGARALWVVYPKGRKDITESMVLAAGRSAGLNDVKVVKFSESHTALKFVIPVGQR